MSATHDALKDDEQQLGSRSKSEVGSHNEYVQPSVSQPSPSAAPVAQRECEQLPCGIEHATAHDPFVQACPPHECPHVPQLFESVEVLAQIPAQHDCAALQTWPQLPQLFLSVAVFVQVLPQRV
jgi:hypothetical protein